MATAFDMKVTGLKEATARLNNGPAITRVTLNDGLRQIGRAFVPSKGTGPLAAATPVSHDTRHSKSTAPFTPGKLRLSTFFQIEATGLNNQRLVILQPARTKTGAFYGMFVREGTKPHTIRPRFKKVLAWSGGGVDFTARVVHHPGSRPNPYHLRVFYALQPQVQGIVAAMGRRMTAYFAGGSAGL